MTLALNDQRLPLPGEGIPPARFRIEILVPDNPDLHLWIGSLSRTSQEFRSLRSTVEMAVDKWLYYVAPEVGADLWIELELEREQDATR